MKLRVPYQKRTIRFHKVIEEQGWRIKEYAITQQNHLPLEPGFAKHAIQSIFEYLPQPATGTDSHGVGFFIIHYGADRNWLLLDWWHDQEILKQQLLFSTINEPMDIKVAESGFLACTWELEQIPRRSSAIEAN